MHTFYVLVCILPTTAVYVYCIFSYTVYTYTYTVYLVRTVVISIYQWVRGFVVRHMYVSYISLCTSRHVARRLNILV